MEKTVAGACLGARRSMPARRRVIARMAGLAGVAAAATWLGACSLGGSANPLTAGTAMPDGAAPAASASGKPVSAKVALLLPLSGSAQAVAVATGMKRAAEMAVFDLNNPSFEMIVKDTQGTPQGAAAAATQAASEGVELIIGPLFAKSVQAVSRVTAQARLPVIAFSNDRNVAGNGVFLLSFMAEEEVERIVSFATSRGKRGLAALVPDNAYGKLMASAFQASAARNGAQIIAMETYPVNSNGMLGPSQKLFKRIEQARAEGLSVDALFLPGGPDTLPNLSPLIKAADVAGMPGVTFLGSGGWDYPNIGRNRTLVGGWYPAPDPRGWQSFSEKYARTFGSAPPRIATLAHDALTVAIQLATQYPRGQRYTAQNLARQNGFQGIDGGFRLDQDGTSRHNLAVLEVQPSKSVVVDPATALTTTGGVSTGALRDLESRSAAVQN